VSTTCVNPRSDMARPSRPTSPVSAPGPRDATGEPRAERPAWLAALDRHALACAILLLLGHLAYKLPGAGDRSLWLDEASTVSLASRSATEIVAAARVNQNPPLYTLAMRPWLALFGTSEAAARSLSTLASAATAAALFLSSRRFFGIEAALYTSLFFAASEPQLDYAREARSYALVGLFCVLSFHLFFTQLARPAWRTAVALGLVNAAAAYTHFTAILAFVAQLACAALLLPSRRRAVFQYAMGQGLALALFAPWLGALGANLPERGKFWLAPPTLALAGETVVELAGGRAALAGQLVVLAIAAGAVIRRGRRGGEDRLAVALTWAALPVIASFAISQRIPAFSLRYLLFASLGWFVAVGAATARLPAPAAARMVAAAALALASATSLGATRSRSADWRSALELTRTESGGRGVIAVAPEWQCLPYSYYLDREAFTDEPRRLARLAEARVSCITAPDELDPAQLGWPERITVVFGKDVPKGFDDLFFRLERAGYARNATRPFQGGNVVGLARVEPTRREPRP